jgi:hypothetical protein
VKHKRLYTADAVLPYIQFLYGRLDHIKKAVDGMGIELGNFQSWCYVAKEQSEHAKTAEAKDGSEALHYECTDCAIGEPIPCTVPYHEDEPVPTECPHGNGTDCEWRLT